MAYDLRETTLSLAYIKQDPVLERGLTYQVSANVLYLPSRVWKDPFVFIFYPALTRASTRFDLYGMCELPAASWTDLARVAEETEDRLRLKNSGPADIFSVGSELRDLLASRCRHPIPGVDILRRLEGRRCSGGPLFGQA